MRQNKKCQFLFTKWISGFDTSASILCQIHYVMKAKHIIYAVAIGLLIFPVGAQDQALPEDEIVWAPKERDPFDTSSRSTPANDPFAKKKTSQQKNNPFIKDPFASAIKEANTGNIIAFVEHIIVPRSKIDQWELNHEDQIISRQLAAQWVKSGEARVAHSSLQVFRNGYSTHVSSCLELIYPTELTPMGEGAWPRPVAFETRNLGYFEEFDLSLIEDKWIQAQLSLEMALFKGSQSHDALIHKTREPDDLFLPEIVTDRIQTRNVFMLNKSQLVGRLNRTTKGDMTRLVFIKFDVGYPAPPKNPIAADKAPIQMSFKIVKIDHKIWSEHFSDMPLQDIRTLSWGWAKKVLAEKKASIIFQGECVVAPRKKITIEEIKEVIYPTQYEPREKDGKPIPAKTIESALVPGGYETRNTGKIMEFQGVRLPAGQVFVSCAWEWIDQMDSTVHHRVKDEGKWVPDVTMPRFISNHQNTSLDLTPGKYSLMGVLAPNTKDGKPDELYRLLAFIRVK